MTTTDGSDRSEVPLDRLAHGIRGHVNRFSHVVINVSDLDRAVEFYEKTLPVQRLTRINGPRQDYQGLGITQGEFQGWGLREQKGYGATG